MKVLLALALLCAPAAPAWSRAGGGGGGGCFAAGTLVTTTAGDIIIEALRPGDRVLAYSDGRLMEVPVRRFIKERGRLLTIITKGGKITTTGVHPFLTRHGFAEAGTFRKGDEIGQLQDGRVVWVKIKKLRPGAETDVYNLEVAPPNTFIANGFVVHNKGGGGGFRSGRHSRGRSIFDLFYIGFMLVVVLIMKIKEFLFGAPAGQASERLFSREEVALRTSQTEKILSSLAAADATLRPALLEAEVRGIFLDMQAAWQARDYSKLAGRMAPELHAGHSAKVERMRAQGEINMMEDVQVQRVDFVHVRYPAAQEDRSVTALITASARDYVLNASGTLVRGSQSPSVFQEFWTFRPLNGRWVPAAINQTTEEYILNAPNLPAQPGQAADIPLQAAAVAAAAAMAVPAPVVPGRQAPMPEQPPAPARYDSSGDPWDRQRMEIAATLAFLNVYGAWEKNKPEELQADALFPETLAKLKELMAAKAKEGLKFEFADLYTRKAEIVLTQSAAGTPSRRDEFTARINASARRALSRGGKPLHKDAAPAPFTEYWVFARDADKRWKFREILPRMRQEGGDGCQLDVAPTPVQLEWYWAG